MKTILWVVAFVGLIGTIVAVVWIFANQETPIVPAPNDKDKTIAKAKVKKNKTERVVRKPVKLPPLWLPGVLWQIQSKRRESVLAHEKAILANPQTKAAFDEVYFTLDTGFLGEEIGASAFSPDGKTLAALGVVFPALPGDHALHLWDLQSRKLLGSVYDDDLEFFPPLQFSPDGKLITAFGWDPIKGMWHLLVWDAVNGNRMRTIELENWRFPLSVAFSPDGKILAVAGSSAKDDDLRWWNMESGEELPLLNVTEPVHGIAFSPDGTTFATAQPKKIQLWATPVTNRLKSFPVQGEARAVAFSPDGKQLATVTSDEIKVIDIATGKANAYPSMQNLMYRTAFVGSGDLLAAMGDDYGILFETSSLKPAGAFFAQDGSQFAISPGGLLASSAAPKYRTHIGIWRMETLLSPELNFLKSAIDRAYHWRNVNVKRQGIFLVVSLDAATATSPGARDADLANVTTLPQIAGLEVRGSVTDKGLKYLKELKDLNILKLEALPQVSDAGLVHLKELPQLDELALVNLPKVSGAGLVHLQHLKKLRYLDLSLTKIDEEHYQYLQHLKKLEVLEPGTIVTDTTMPHLAALTALQELYLAHTRISDDGLKHLQGLTKLKTLDLANTPIGDEGLAALTKMTDLSWLDLSDTQVRTLAGIKGLPNLETLNLSGSRVDDDGLAVLPTLQALKKLELQRTSGIRGPGLVHLAELKHINTFNLHTTAIDDRGFSHIRALPDVEGLVIPQRVTDNGLLHLSKLKKLKWLVMNKQITNGGLQHLKYLTNLKELELVNCRIGDAGLKQLTPLVALEFIKLKGTPIKGSGLAHLKALPKLQELDLSDTLVDDAALKHLQSMKTLQRVKLDNTKVTRQGVENLRKLLPKVTFEFAP